MSHPEVPAGYHSVSPSLIVPSIPERLALLVSAFDASEIEHIKDGAGSSMHAEVRIGDSVVMIGQKPRGEGAAGATGFQEPADQPYGDRTAAINDPAGHQWWIATRKETLSGDEPQKRATTK